MNKLQETPSETFVAKYKNIDIRNLGLSLYQYFNLLKNNALTKKRLYHTMLEVQENLHILLQNNMQEQN
jgi:hypothetical protein